MKRRISMVGPLYYVFLAVFLYLPIAFLILFSFNDSVVLAFPIKGFTLDWYKAVLKTPELVLAFRNTLWVGTISSVISTVLGAMAAIVVTRYSFRGHDVFSSLSTFPMVIPYLVLGVALLLFFNAVASRRGRIRPG